MFDREQAAHGAGSVYFDASRPGGGRWVAQVSVTEHGSRRLKRRIRRTEREALDALMEMRGGTFEYPEAPFDVVDTGCWIWNGRVDGNGYGVVTLRGIRMEAHRLYYQMHVAPLRRLDTVDHLCRTHPCVNPAHLQAVTRQENSRRRGVH